MCRVRTRSKREARSQNLTRKTSHMLNIPYNFLNGFELISKMTRGTSKSAEIRRSAEKSHVCLTIITPLSRLLSLTRVRTDCLVGLVVKVSVSRAADLSSIPPCAVDPFSDQVIPMSLTLEIYWLSCQAAGIFSVSIGTGQPRVSVLWLGEIVWSATSN